MLLLDLSLAFYVGLFGESVEKFRLVRLNPVFNIVESPYSLHSRASGLIAVEEPARPFCCILLRRLISVRFLDLSGAHNCLV